MLTRAIALAVSPSIRGGSATTSPAGGVMGGVGAGGGVLYSSPSSSVSAASPNLVKAWLRVISPLSHALITHVATVLVFSVSARTPDRSKST